MMGSKPGEWSDAMGISRILNINLDGQSGAELALQFLPVSHMYNLSLPLLARSSQSKLVEEISMVSRIVTFVVPVVG